MKYGSVCSGIEAATQAWHPLGWEAQFFSEIEPFPCGVLQHHYPDVPLHGDFTTIEENTYGSIRLLVGGTPCQSFSVAGLRKGMADDRGNLALEYLRLAQRLGPTWLVWENVPGVLSSNGGRDFGAFLGGLVELGYGFSYRVLDAIYFGVAAKRRRVFVIGYLGDWRPPVAVLFERESLAGTLKKKPKINGRGPRFFMPGNRARDREIPEVLGARDHKDPQIVCSPEFVRRLTPVEYERLLGFPDDYTKIPRQNSGKRPRNKTSMEPESEVQDNTGTVSADDGKPEQSVRHLRVPDGSACSRSRPRNRNGTGNTMPPVQHQAAGNRGRGVDDAGMGVPIPRVADGPRYKALGNSMAEPVMRWIGERINIVDKLIQ